MGDLTSSDSETVDYQFDDDSSVPCFTGIWAGIAIALSCIVLWHMLMEFVIYHEPISCLTGNAAHHSYWPMYSNIFTIALWAVCWSLLLIVWTGMGCDYSKILGIRAHSKHDCVRFGGKLIIMVCLGRWIFNHTQHCRRPFHHLVEIAAYQPLVLCIFICAYIMYRSGCALPRLIFATVVSPFAAAGVTALHAYVGDVFTSLVKPLQGVVYIACFYGTGELTLPAKDGRLCEDYVYHSASPFSVGNLILLFPNVLRIAQNLRQYRDTGHKHPCLTNTFKYVLSLAITAYGLFHRSRKLEITEAHGLMQFWIYVAALVLSSLYSFAWDITMDWNLFTSSASFLCIPYKNVQMRKRRLLEGLRPYIVASAADFVLRFFYVYNFVPNGSFSFRQEFIDTCAFFAPQLEILRRAMWSVFKMEAMQLKADDAAAVASQGEASTKANVDVEEEEQLFKIRN